MAASFDASSWESLRRNRRRTSFAAPPTTRTTADPARPATSSPGLTFGGGARGGLPPLVRGLVFRPAASETGAALSRFAAVPAATAIVHRASSSANSLPRGSCA